MEKYLKEEEFEGQKWKFGENIQDHRYKRNTLFDLKVSIPNAYMKYGVLEVDDDALLIVKADVFFKKYGHEFKVLEESGKYTIDIDTSKIGNIDPQLKKEIKSSMNPPEEILKLTNKGIKDWIDFEKQFYKELKSILKNEKSLSFTL